MVVYIYSAAILLYLISTVIPSDLISNLISLASLLAIIVSFRQVKGIVQLLSGILLAIGLIVMIIDGAGVLDIIFSFGYMINVLTLFALVPLMAIPMQLGHYGQDIQRIIGLKVKSSGKLYALTAGLTHFLGVFTYLASLPMMYHAIRPSADLYPIGDKEKFMSRAITHGFSMTTMWTPVAPILATVLVMTEASWASVVPYVLILAILGLVMAMVYGFVIEKRSMAPLAVGVEASIPAPVTTPISSSVNSAVSKGDFESNSSSLYRKVWHVVIAIAILSLIIVLMERLLPISFLLIIIILVIPFGLAWSLFINKGKSFLEAVAKHPAAYLPKMKDQFVIFLSAGFLITVLSVTEADLIINQVITDFKDIVGVQVFIVLIPLIPLALAFIGFHPAVALALVAQSLNAEMLGISPQLLSVAMLAGAAASFLMGPYNATIGMMSGLVKRSPFHVSNWNFAYTVGFLILSMCFLIVLQIWL